MNQSNKKMKFCCPYMEYEIEEQNNPNPDGFSSNAIYYIPMFREFCCYTRYGDTDCGRPVIDYCPFCGTKLPKSLSDEYDIELEKVLGKEGYEALFYYKDEGVFKECPVIDRAKVPEEFKADKWWIKRGL